MVEDVCRRYSEGFCNGCDYCVLYSSEDYQDVSHVKQCIRDSGYSVYDHNEDGLLGRYKLDNMTAGVLKCKNAIIFLSTSFIASQRHKYEMKFTLQSKDTNSILVLKLGECTTPECIRCFGLYVIPLERKQISSKMVLKALTDPKSVLAQSSSDKNLTFENGWGSGDVDQRGVRKLLKGDQSNRPKLCPVCLECVPAEKFEEHMSLHPSIHSRTYTDESNIHDKTEQMLDNRRETSNYFYQKKFTSNATAVKRGRTLCRLEQMTWTDLIEVFSIAIPQDNHCRMSKSIFG
ncbi:hypothetical protein ScPMuIL_000985 [Solemya velum]